MKKEVSFNFFSIITILIDGHDHNVYISKTFAMLKNLTKLFTFKGSVARVYDYKILG